MTLSGFPGPVPGPGPGPGPKAKSPLPMPGQQLVQAAFQGGRPMGEMVNLPNPLTPPQGDTSSLPIGVGPPGGSVPGPTPEQEELRRMAEVVRQFMAPVEFRFDPQDAIRAMAQPVTNRIPE